MTLRRIILKAVIAAVAVLVAGTVLLAVRGKSPPQLMYCGHPKEFRFPLMPYVKTHCSSLRAINDLKMLYLAQRIHENDTGTNATTLQELGEMFPTNRIRSGLTLLADGTNWSARVPKQDSFARHYLLTRVGQLYFNPDRTAATNDYVLHDWSK